MADFKDRESAFENKFVLDEALLFKAEARCCKLFGLWLGEKLGFSEDKTTDLAADLISANLEEPGFDDLRRAIVPIIIENGANISNDEVNAKIEELFLEAQKQIKEESA